MSLSLQNGLQSDDCAASIEKSTCSNSVDKCSYRASVFVEHPDLPPVWGKDSLSGYKGQRVLGILPGIHPGERYANSGPLGAYDPRYNDDGSMSRPLDIGYEMPERYGGKEMAWKEEGGIPLAGNNNSWAPPVVQQKRICGVSRWIFWTVVGCMCFLIVGGVTGGVVSGIASSKKSASSNSSNSTSTTASLALATSYSTSTSSVISTSTLSNGNVILVTEIFTAIQTFAPQATTISKSQYASATESSSSTSTFPTTSTSVTLLAGSTDNTTFISTNPLSRTSTTTTTATSGTSTATPSSSTNIILSNLSQSTEAPSQQQQAKTPQPTS